MPDIGHLFSLSISPVEIVIRGTAIYWFLFLLFRFVLRRDVGSIAITDVLLLVLIADAAQNAMAGGYDSITDGCLLVATIAGWNYLLDWAAFHSERVRRFVEGNPVQLVRNGRILRGNLRRELLTVADLMSALRTHGIDDISEVKLASMETDGEISVLKAEKGGEPEKARRGSPPGA
ncbi:MAG TPA: YetF domain-containing protein [Flavobacteriales bacterium]|jgi:uncharacterized membrane protein YcaP (DUF421 family)|nr:YetF domain-containing protein [Flavobacteriales bacterium]